MLEYCKPWKLKLNLYRNEGGLLNTYEQEQKQIVFWDYTLASILVIVYSNTICWLK